MTCLTYCCLRFKLDSKILYSPCWEVTVICNSSKLNVSCFVRLCQPIHYSLSNFKILLRRLITSTWYLSQHTKLFVPYFAFLVLHFLPLFCNFNFLLVYCSWEFLKRRTIFFVVFFFRYLFVLALLLRVLLVLCFSFFYVKSNKILFICSIFPNLSIFDLTKINNFVENSLMTTNPGAKWIEYSINLGSTV